MRLTAPERRDFPPGAVFSCRGCPAASDSSCPSSRCSLLALPGGAAAADKPSNKTLYYDGPSGRYLMDGTWLFRLDPGNRGIWQRLEPQPRARRAGAA